MKLVRFRHKGAISRGTLEGDKISVEGSSEIVGLGEVVLVAPVNPSKIVAVGLNYKDHAKELGMDIPEEPIIFMKPTTAIIGPEESIIYPPASKQVDYEAELAVVIKDKIRGITADQAESHIEGYTCLNDVTARDLQKKDKQWTRAKSFDTFCPIGPWIETDLDPRDVRICSYLNGELKQDSRTSDLIFSVPELVAFISGIMTLFPGDVIATGTPSGIGPMSDGDNVVIEIEGIGKLSNNVKQG